jgi:hypothetical protein
MTYLSSRSAAGYLTPVENIVVMLVRDLGQPVDHWEDLEEYWDSLGGS